MLISVPRCLSDTADKVRECISPYVCACVCASEARGATKASRGAALSYRTLVKWTRTPCFLLSSVINELIIKMKPLMVPLSILIPYPAFVERVRNSIRCATRRCSRRARVMETIRIRCDYRRRSGGISRDPHHPWPLLRFPFSTPSSPEIEDNIDIRPSLYHLACPQSDKMHTIIFSHLLVESLWQLHSK